MVPLDGRGAERLLVVARHLSLARRCHGQVSAGGGAGKGSLAVTQRFHGQDCSSLTYIDAFPTDFWEVSRLVEYIYDNRRIVDQVGNELSAS